MMFWKRLKYRKCFGDYCVTLDGRLVNVKNGKEVWPGLRGRYYLGEFDVSELAPQILPVNKRGDPPGIHNLAIWKMGNTQNRFWVSIGMGIGHYMLEYEPKNDCMVYRYFPLSDGFYEFTVPWEYGKYFWTLAGRPLEEFKKESGIEKVRLMKKFSPFENEPLVFMNITPEVQEFVLRPGVYVRIENSRVRLGTVSVHEIHQHGVASNIEVFARDIAMTLDIKSWLALDTTPDDLYTAIVF